jgi:hypothetical protein
MALIQQIVGGSASTSAFYILEKTVTNISCLFL